MQFSPASSPLESRDRIRSRLPLKGGLSLKPQHYHHILRELPKVGWFEIHAENYLGGGGAPLHYLSEIRQHYELSIHGVGLSIGSTQGLDPTHLKRVADLVDRFEPASFSEHLAWSTHDNQFYSDLLPVPYNAEVENLVCDHIDQVQNRLGRQMLLENPSNYLSMDSSTITESELLANIVRRTGCGLLLDVNNVYISANNCDYSALDYISSLPLKAVGEIHLAGHAVDASVSEEPLLIDTHDREVSDPVWQLYKHTLRLTGPKATLIEWDSDVPEWAMFESELTLTNAILDATTVNQNHADAC